MTTQYLSENYYKNLNLIKVQYLQYFLDYLRTNNLFEKFKNTKHSYKTDKDNPHHIENDLWTHTLLTLNAVEQLYSTEYYKSHSYNDYVNLIIIALFHDIGKMNTVEINEENGRVSFKGHSFNSVQYVIDFIGYLDFSPEMNFEDEDLFFIINSVSNHDKFYNIFRNSKNIKTNNIPLIFNNNVYLFYYLMEIIWCDYYGSFSNQSTVLKINGENVEIDDIYDMIISRDVSFIQENDFNDSETSDTIKTYPVMIENIYEIDDVFNECDVIFMSGVSGSGKDYIAKQYVDEENILSYDKIRMNIYREYMGTDNITYNDAHSYYMKNKTNLNSPLTNQIKEKYNNGEKIVISNTNLKKSGRTPIVNICRTIEKNMKIGFIYVICDKQTCIERDSKRDKGFRVGKNVIDKQSFYINIPSMYNEKFDMITICNNMRGG